MLSARGAPTAWQRIGSLSALRSVPLALAVVLGAAATATVVIALALTSGGGGGSRGVSAARKPGPPGVAAAYGYPLRCLSVAIALHDPRFARADFDRTLPCGRYAGYATAIFRRSGGRWRPVLDALGYSCPVRALPPRVRAELAVCP